MVEQQIGYQLKRAQHALRLSMDSALSDLGLTTAQYAALSALEAAPGLSNAALARRCFVTAQTMNAIVMQLEASGLIERRQHPEHGRVLQTTLTAEGQQRVTQAHRIVGRIEEQMVQHLDQAERQQFFRWLQACTSALESKAE
jgi:DNA-binding MarR family transcriptional regulator